MTAVELGTPVAGQEAVEHRPAWEHAAFYIFVIAPPIAVIAGGFLWWYGEGMPVVAVVLGAIFYVLTGLGVTVGYHRLLTHRSFKARRVLKIGLAIAGSMAIQGGVIRWVADHRKHHHFSDGPGDPHSPWRYGGGRHLVRGLWWAHLGWLFSREQALKARYAPDLVADRDIVRVHRWFPLWVALSVLAPPAIALAITHSLAVAGVTLLWASLARIFLLHHVTFAINSICHVIGTRPYATRDKATNVWPLALLSFGESWHNLHHADPTCARHGAQRGQVDISAACIRVFERLGWATAVRWPQPQRLADRQRVVGLDS